jgi:parvulin-like peptidyl-prolyl isomerase
MKAFGFLLLALATAGPDVFAAEAATPPVAKTSLTDLFDDPVLARGKGFEIKRSQLEEAFVNYRARLTASGQNLLESQRTTREARLLDQLVITRILVNRATAEDKARAKELAEKFLAERKKVSSSEDMFYLQLKALGLSREQFQKRLDEEALAEAVMDREIKATISIADEQVKEFYDAGSDRLVKIMQEELERLVKDPASTPAQLAAVKEQVDKLRQTNLSKLDLQEQVRITHIFVPIVNRDTGEADSEDEKKAKRGFMDKLLLRARAGEDFARLVQDFSLDPNLKETKGEYVISRSDQYSPEFKAAAFSLTNNQISEVVATSLGMHIIKQLERMSPRKVEFDKAAKEIKEHLVQQAMQYHMPSFFARIKKEAGVEILEPKYKLSTAEETRSLRPPG